MSNTNRQGRVKARIRRRPEDPSTFFDCQDGVSTGAGREASCTTGLALPIQLPYGCRITAEDYAYVAGDPIAVTWIYYILKGLA